MTPNAPRHFRPDPKRLVLPDPLFWLFVVGLLIRCCVSADLLDRYYPYDLAGGAPLMKIHPGSYVIFGCALAATTRPLNLQSGGMVPPALLLVLLSVTGMAWTAITGALTAIGALFDLYLVGAAGLFTVSRFSEAQRRWLFHGMLALLGLNLILLVAEFLTQQRLITVASATTAGVFRPAGLFGHPLANGLIYALASPLMIRLKGPLALRVTLAGLAVAGVLIAGARAASIVAVAMLPLTIFVALRNEPNRTGLQQWAVWLQFVLMATALPVTVLAALLGGLGYRFSNGLFDESSLKRINDFHLLTYLRPQEWWVGGNVLAVQGWSKRLFTGDSIESPVVLGIFTYGLPVTIVILGLLVLALTLLALRSGAVEKLALLSFVIIAFTANGLMVKGMILLFLLVAVAAAGGGTVSDASGGRRPLRRVRFRELAPVRRWRAPAPTGPLGHLAPLQARRTDGRGAP